ncbi:MULTISPECIES: hypothetical protein [unclassified Caballeronia]|uniref:hypothetical protein n=1 Tax=unclassified Caballeronia TaxID=2646786 RepID=UPI00202820A2|nr:MULTISPECIES: hypothetical protein [unclassified Caballeronia]
MSQMNSHGPIEEGHRQTMRETGAILSDVFRGYGFALFVFELNAPGRFNYLSNANADDMVNALRAFIEAMQRDRGQS